MLYDRQQAEHAFTPGVYCTDQVTLWRILDLAERRKGMLPLEDCRFPQCGPIWRSIEWLLKHEVKVVKR